MKTLSRANLSIKEAIVVTFKENGKDHTYAIINKEITLEIFSLENAKFEYLSEFEIHGKVKKVSSLFVDDESMQTNIILALLDNLKVLVLEWDEDSKSLKAVGSINYEMQ